MYSLNCRLTSAEGGRRGGIGENEGYKDQKLYLKQGKKVHYWIKDERLNATIWP